MPYKYACVHKEKIMKLTAKQKKDYIKSGYSKCPKCKSDDIDGGMVEVDAGTCWQPVSCNECHLEWSDIYTLAGIEVTG